MKKSPNIPSIEPNKEPYRSQSEQDEAWVLQLFKFGLIWILFVFIFFFTVITISIKK